MPHCFFDYVVLAEKKSIRPYFSPIGAYDKTTCQYINGAVDITDKLDSFSRTDILEGVYHGEQIKGRLTNNVILFPVDRLMNSCEYIEGTAIKAVKKFRVVD